MVRDFLDSEKNVFIRYLLLLWVVVSAIASVSASISILLASNATDAMILNAVQSDDFNVWGMVSTVITSGGYIKSASLTMLIAYVVVSYISLYFSSSILNLYVKDLPIKTLFRAKYWTSFYRGGVMYDEYIPKAKPKKKL
ncbi:MULTISPECIES: hypothetical protein [Vibrio]|uniref:hypothetical protein n=1 Tax=Vibrio TaxID=662 RepID=UPI0005F19763|nr:MULTISPECIES: hypothetical protein [Vibrio]EJG0767364.1 hypothetical protein [Vibrio parahaemolyticus O5:K30]EGR2220696.1 hypothetical protein [Vibrio parahaemolyticus]MBE4202793.1 hypothetical protein [Vibrio parahaemolyticus]MDG2755698.1 hypothetical protein [Vibrio parahaemolyticus]MDG3024844.1 hypothetical protein [Vibrio parahaemolyticus]